MADGNKKKPDLNEVFYNIFVVLAVIGLLYYTYLRINGMSLYFMGSIFGCDTAGFFAAFLFLGIRISALLTRTGGKFNLRLWTLTAAAALVFVCGISSFTVDVKHSKLIDVLTIDGETTVLLSEYTERDKLTDTEYVYLDVYRSNGKTVAKKLGQIDETYFAVRCVDTDSYTYTVSDEGIFTLDCQYVSYGGGQFVLAPYADTGHLTYDFKLN